MLLGLDRKVGEVVSGDDRVTRIYFVSFWLGLSSIRAVSAGYILAFQVIISPTVIFLVHVPYYGINVNSSGLRLCSFWSRFHVHLTQFWFIDLAGRVPKDICKDDFFRPFIFGESLFLAKFE